MKIVSTQRRVRVAPRKLRLVADMVRDMSPMEALEILPFVQKRGAESVGKVIKSAMANARDKGISDEGLQFSAVEISEGPKLKRWRPVSRGRAHPFARKTSHIRVVLESVEKEDPKETKNKS